MSIESLRSFANELCGLGNERCSPVDGVEGESTIKLINTTQGTEFDSTSSVVLDSCLMADGGICIVTDYGKSNGISLFSPNSLLCGSSAEAGYEVTVKHSVGQEVEIPWYKRAYDSAVKFFSDSVYPAADSPIYDSFNLYFRMGAED